MDRRGLQLESEFARPFAVPLWVGPHAPRILGGRVVSAPRAALKLTHLKCTSAEPAPVIREPRDARRVRNYWDPPPPLPPPYRD